LNEVLPRNTLHGPGLINLDLNIAHDFISRKTRRKHGALTVALNSFNVLNHRNATTYVGCAATRDRPDRVPSVTFLWARGLGASATADAAESPLQVLSDPFLSHKSEACVFIFLDVAFGERIIDPVWVLPQRRYCRNVGFLN